MMADLLLFVGFASLGCGILAAVSLALDWIDRRAAR